MTFRTLGLAIVVTFNVSLACGERSVGQCDFNRAAEMLLIPKDSTPRPLQVTRRNDEPNALLIVRDENESGDAREALRVDQGTSTEVSIPFATGQKWPPAGYTAFVSGPPTSQLDPLIEAGRLRFEYLGQRSKVPFFEGDGAGKWSLAHDDEFTGTRRLVFGNRTLLTQTFNRLRAFTRVEQYVQIEPDGDRIVCVCYDLRGTWIAVFSKKKLEAEQKK